MKKYSAQFLLASATVLSASLQAQTNSNSNVQTFTNADLTPPANPTAPSTPSNPAIPGSSSGTANQNASKYPALTQDQIQQFNDQMYAQVQASEQRVQSLMTMVQDPTHMPMSIDKVQLEAAIMDLDVKKTLAAKFSGSPSIKSPKVRQVLMQVLSKNYIQESDLAALQAVVDTERPYTYP
jgi:hypothetical protein